MGYWCNGNTLGLHPRDLEVRAFCSPLNSRLTKEIWKKIIHVQNGIRKWAYNITASVTDS